MKPIKDPELKRWFAANAEALSSVGGKAKAQAVRWAASNKEAVVEPTKAKEYKPNSKAFWQGQSFGPASPVRKIDPATYKPTKG